MTRVGTQATASSGYAVPNGIDLRSRFDAQVVDTTGIWFTRSGEISEIHSQFAD